MAEPQKTLFLDEEVGPQLLGLFRQAQHYIVIVTPYLDLWRHAEEAIALALARGVKVTVILRSENGVTQSDISVLLGSSVEILAVEYLHAKIYLNEHQVVVGSMNLSDFSKDNSKEIALLVRDKQVEQELRSYVNDRLMRLAKRVAPATAKLESRVAKKPSRRNSDATAGACIRCGGSIALNPERPLCPGCYEVWVEYSDEDYPEHCCHSCGRTAITTYARPLCSACYRRPRS